ncbi:ATPase, AAA family protein [Trichomonas vaginalis G3]|uniref:ATPase, AAA family protein n=1 Tax=Trichomonas vaginalis (strain ATCC PRA-98 / G3) TaxID=412133 RepID=A2D8M7_TRIV3|nr:positive regulation of centriole elongation [Trichomonas vaginalis G3]EAY23276.1 ATPase, AAA family protein [Trichomonas vaginalis G3]KAI5534075.1 positive regulation of centriole elongation [Trichomonas vaginalis G3]|eukprot:XP_001584262.1 ATPase, AAA family protein [Trichomonas vaginalis G3]
MQKRNLFQQYFNDGVNLIKNAVAMDNAGQYEQAKNYYNQAAAKFNLAKKQAGPQTSENLLNKATEHAERCTKRASELDNIQPAAPSAAGGSSGAAQASKPSNKKQGGGGGGGGKDGKENDENSEFESRMASAILVEKPNIKWEDVAGLNEAKRSLYEAVIYPIRFKQFFVGERTPWRGILLYGPPGTGKSYLAKATASEANNSTFISISTSDLVSKWLGESEKLIRALFDTARKSAPAIIFIDEVDSLLSERSENDSESSRRIKTEFLVQMDGVGKSMEGLLVLSATNTPWILDPAVRRRFEKKVYIPLPDFEARKAMVTLRLKGTPHNITPDQAEKIAHMTEGYSGADIKILSREASMLAIRNLMDKQEWFRMTERGTVEACAPNAPGARKWSLRDPDFPADKIESPPVKFEDFKEAICKIHPTVSPAELVKYQTWTNEFGSEGN